MTSSRMSAGARSSAGRIVGHAVPMLVPEHGPVHVLIVGEAPGPRGADKSGYPFFGDAAGVHLYTALERIAAVTLPFAMGSIKWDGALFAAGGHTPTVHGVALTNALDRCPTDDGDHFRAPTRTELESPVNVARLMQDIERLIPRGLQGVVTLGRVATQTMTQVVSQYRTRHSAATLSVHGLPHPSAQGLLSMAPDRGKGARLRDLQEAWMQRCQQLIVEAGHVVTNAVHAGRGDAR